MSSQMRYGRRLVLVLLPIFLLACRRSDCAWEYHHTKGCASQFDSAQILFPRRTASDALSVEVVRGSSQTRLYVNLFFCPIDDGIDQIEVRYNGKTCSAQVMQGGQRVLLSGDAAEEIIVALLDGCPVELTVGLYQAVIPPSNFSTAYAEMCEL